MHRTLAGTALVLAIAAFSAAAPASGAPAAKTCDVLKDAQRLGPSYVTSLTVQGVSCTTGKRVVRAYYRCRIDAGGVRSLCHKRVLGYRCRELREGVAVQFDAKVTCTRGTRRVRHTYTQNT